MTASTWYNNDHLAQYGRLRGSSGWCAQTSDGKNDWLKVDLGKTFEICGVATQGDVDNDDWVTDFKLSYSNDGSDWTNYLNTDGSELVNFNLLQMLICFDKSI